MGRQVMQTSEIAPVVLALLVFVAIAMLMYMFVLWWNDGDGP
jgi:hypothetical protein